MMIMAGIFRHKFVPLIYTFLIGVGLMLTASACSRANEPALPEITPQIVFLFSPGGLGDMSYNDCIFEGVQKFKKSHPEVDIFLSSPPDMETAERIYSDWLKRPGSNIPVLFVLASSDFEALVDKYLDLYQLSDNKSLLLFESLKVYENPRIRTFQISMYGASYLAGITARSCAGDSRSLILLGSSTDVPTFSARDGFIDGLGSPDYDVQAFADDWSGYVMAPEAYRSMSTWARQYGFIFPVAGGTNSGIYRYSRENNDCPYLAGMDVDQSDLSPKITGSVVKLFDNLVEEYFTDWLTTGEMPESQIYGLDSGYVDWVISQRYESQLREITELYRLKAIEKENEYYSLNN